MDDEWRPRIPGLDPDEENPLHDRQPGDPIELPEEPEEGPKAPEPRPGPYTPPPVH